MDGMYRLLPIAFPPPSVEYQYLGHYILCIVLPAPQRFSIDHASLNVPSRGRSRPLRTSGPFQYVVLTLARTISPKRTSYKYLRRSSFPSFVPAGGEGAAANARRVAGVKRSSRGRGDEATPSAPTNATRSTAGGTKRRKQSFAAEQPVAAAVENEAVVSGDAAAGVAPAPAGPASDDNEEVSDDDMNLFGDEEDACPSPCDDAGGPGSALADSPGDETEQEESGDAVPASTAAGKAVIGGASSSGKGKARSKRGVSAPKRGSGGGGGGGRAHAPGVVRGGKGKGKAAAKTAGCGSSRGGGGGKGSGSGGSAAATTTARGTGRGQRAAGKRKRGAGAVAGGGDGDTEEGGEKSNPQQGVVRVIFSGLQPEDRQVRARVWG